MKTVILSICIFCFTHFTAKCQIISGGPTASAFSVLSTTKGVLTPRMTKTERTSIVNPATGLLVYQTDSLPGFYFYAGSGWKNLGTASLLIQDSDQNTKMQVEENNDDDVVRFDLSGDEVMVLRANDFTGSRIEFPSNNGNILMGNNAGRMVTGAGNVALGDSALMNTVQGTQNLALGSKALYSNISGIANLAIGTEALYTNTLDSNFAIGYQALRMNASGKLNTALGYQSMLDNTTGAYNTAINTALENNTTGSFNTAIGDQSMMSNTTGSHNTAIGTRALVNNTTGIQNTVLSLPFLLNPDDSHTLSANVDGYENTVAGLEAMRMAVSGYQTTAIGAYALNHLTTGINNIALGTDAMRNLTTGESNVAIGYHALTSLTTGSRNTFLGKGESSPNASYQLTSNLAIANIDPAGRGFENNLGTVVGYSNLNDGFNGTVIGKQNWIHYSLNNGNDHTLIGQLPLYPVISNSLILGNLESRIGIGTTSPHSSALMEVTSLTKGFLFPRVMSKENVQISQFENDMLLYDKTLKSFYKSTTIGSAYRWINLNNMFDAIYSPSDAGKIPVWDGSTWSWSYNSKIEDIDANSNMRLTNDAKFVIRLNGQDRFRISRILSSSKQMVELLTENNCLYFGNNAGLNAGLSSGNTAIGYNTLKNVSATGNQNTAFGSEALTSNTNGSSNTAAGKNALTNNTVGNGNTAVGTGALSAMISGNYNTAVGHIALNDITDGNYNTVIGYDAEVEGSGISYASAIGYKARVTQSHSMVLGSINGVNGATTTARVGIGCSDPQKTLHIRSYDAGGQPILVLKNDDLDFARIQFKESTVTADWGVLGKPADVNADARFNFFYTQTVFSLHGNGDAVLAGTLTQTSDRRLKKNISQIVFDEKYLNDIHAYTYYWKDKEKSRHRQIGFIAQEIELLFPTMLRKEDGILSLNYFEMTPMILEGIKSMNKEINTLDQGISEVQKELQNMKTSLLSKSH